MTREFLWDAPLVMSRITTYTFLCMVFDEDSFLGMMALMALIFLINIK